MRVDGPLVADTHTFVWYAGRSPRLSKRARDALNAATAAEAPIFVSAMSIVELRYLVEKGTISESDFEVLVSEFEKSDSPYEVAAAVTLGVPLVTADRKLREQVGVEANW